MIKHKLLSLFVALIATTALWASNTITYTATSKLSETTDFWSEGLHTDAFNVSISSHTFSKGTGTITFSGEVTTIGSSAFYGCSGLTSVSIPNSVTTIGDCAFDGCSGLTSVTIGNSVTTIGVFAFSNCSGLIKTNYTGTVADWCKIKFAYFDANPMYYSYNFYINDVEVKDLVIPEGVDTIGDYAFEFCSGLTSVSIPNSVTTIGRCAFRFCSSLTSVSIPNSVTTIGESAFSGVLNIAYSGTATGSPWGAECVNGYVDGYLVYSDATKTKLWRCSSAAIGEITIPNSVTTIGESAFNNCSGLTSVTIGNSVTTIGDYAFYNCSGLTSVTIGNSVKEIGFMAFHGCSNNMIIKVPCGMIGYYRAFSGLYNFTFSTYGDFVYNYQIQSPDETYCPVAILSEPDCENSDITFAAYPKLYFRFDGWSDGVQSLERTITITQDTTIVALGAYDNTCGENLTWSLDTISGILTISGSGAMNRVPWANWASMVKIINLPEELTTITAGAFAECSNVKEITIPTTVTSIGDGAFVNCTGLRTITCFATNPPLAENYVFYGISQYTKTYVLASSLEAYQFALGWRDLNLLPIGSTETTITTDTVIIQPSVTEVTFTWPQYDQAAGYSIEITKDGVVFCTLKFNAQGQLTGIAFAPSRGGQRTMPAAEMTANGWQFTVTGLNQASNYAYTLDALNASQQSIKHYEGEFTTTGATGLEQLTVDNAQCTIRKMIIDNQLFIFRDNKIFNAAGVLVK